MCVCASIPAVARRAEPSRVVGVVSGVVAITSSGGGDRGCIGGGANGYEGGCG